MGLNTSLVSYKKRLGSICKGKTQSTITHKSRTWTARETNPANTLTLALSIQSYKKQISAIQTTQSVLSYFGDPSKLIERIYEQTKAKM